MKPVRFLIIFIALTAMASFTSGKAFANGYGENFCSQTARSLSKACFFDVKDDLHETLANCINVQDSNARAECIAEARQAKREGRENCRAQKSARFEVCELIGEARYADPLLDSDIVFVDPDVVGSEYAANPYVSIVKGHTYVLRAGEDFEETVVVHVTDEVREAEGYDGEPVLCRVVVDAVMVLETDEEDGSSEWVVDELTDDYFAQDDTGIVYYCGEISRNYEDGNLVNLDGSFFSGVDFAKAGVLIRQAPAIGQVDRQEYAAAEAEDLVEYVDLNAVPGDDEGGQNPNDFAFACDGDVPGDCLKTFDSSALDPASTEFKYYRKGVGFVLAVSMEDGDIDGEREELVCVGDSLDILSSADCGLNDVEALLETLCELSPQAFCQEDE